MKRKQMERFFLRSITAVTPGMALGCVSAALAAALLLFPAPAVALDAPARPLMKRKPRPLPFIKTMPNRPGLAVPAPGGAPAYDFSGVRMEYDMPVSGTLPPLASPTETHFNPDGSVRSYNRGPLAINNDAKWAPGTTITVKMMGGSAKVRAKVRQYAEEWMKYANIRFQFVADSQPAVIRVGFGTDGTSWSYLGRYAEDVPSDEETMHFGWFDDGTSESEFSRVILHEFGHALGLIHEHQSPAAGIPWDKEKVYAFFEQMDPPWSRAKVDGSVFYKSSVSTTNYSQYDPTSIMHYEFPASLTLNGQGTQRWPVLSDTDKRYIGIFYPWPAASTGDLALSPRDDCDRITFRVEYGVEQRGKTRFKLHLGNGMTWWKMVEVPVAGGQYARMEVQNDTRMAEILLDKADLDGARSMRFSKAKFLGGHTLLGYTWNVVKYFPDAGRVTLFWEKDSCG